METGKPGLVSAPVHISSITAQTERRMDIQAPLRAVYIRAVPALPVQPYPQPTAAVREPATLHLAMPPLYSNETLPFLTLHIAGGLHSQPGLSMAASGPTARPKSTGKHVCPHCQRDCMKPSVLEKHLRCHTGERPYPCTTCGVSFKTQSNLYKHKRTQAHARLSSESEQTSLGSLDSRSISQESCTSSLSMDEHSCESGSMEKETAPPPCPTPSTVMNSVQTQGSLCDPNGSTPADQPREGANATLEEDKQRVKHEEPPSNVSRHLPLQRQEATQSYMQRKSPVAAICGKSQSRESTDSGYSESSDHYLSSASVLLDHSMDSLTESTKEEERTSTSSPLELGQDEKEPKDCAKQEQKTLVEHISKIISENKAVLEDKQLDNVRPRKTVLSKQGSIDLPMPYTYKDSFHFDMKLGKNVGLQRNKAPGLYSSVPCQHSSTADHAPLTRSNSLPFSVPLLQPEGSSPTSSYHSDYETLVRRGSSGQIHPTSFTIGPVKQQASTHRPLVRQTAVDCNHATDGHFINSSVEEVCTGSLSCDGDGGESCAEPSSRKFRRKKAQKFAYNKWYMYGDGAFKKLYSTEKGGDNTVIKGRKCLNPEQEAIQSSQRRASAVHTETTTTSSAVNVTNGGGAVSHPGSPQCKPPMASGLKFDLKHRSVNIPVKAPLRRNLSLTVLPSSPFGSAVSLKSSSADSGRLSVEAQHSESTSQLCGARVPSDRKKQKTDDKLLNTVTHPLPSVPGSVPQQETKLRYINFPENQKHAQVNDAVFLPHIINANVQTVSTSTATSVSSAAKTSFLPKYQLKLPNAAEADSNCSFHVVDKPSGTDVATPPSSAPTKLNSPLVSTAKSSCEEVIKSLFMQSCDVENTTAFSSTLTQLLPPRTATTLCPKSSPPHTALTSSLPAVHRQSAATTVTTTCLKDHHAGICSTLIQPTKSATGSPPVQLPTNATNVPVRPATTTTRDQTSASEGAGHPTPNQPVSLSHPPPALNLIRPGVGPDSSAVPCHILPFNQEQPVTQNVFHVHTADLQICLQIISDEQLALMEPQIERETRSSHSPRNQPDAPAAIQNNSDTSSNKGRDHEQPGLQEDTGQSGCRPTINTEAVQSPLSVHFGKGHPNTHTSGRTYSSQTASSAGPKPPETSGSTLHPHIYSNVSTATETWSAVGNVMSTAASPTGAKSQKHQTSGEEHDVCLNYSVEDQILLDKRVNKGQPVSEPLSDPQNLNAASFPPGTGAQNSTEGDFQGSQRQEKLQADTEAKFEVPAGKSNRVESGEIHSSTDKCKGLKGTDQAWICHKPPEPTLSGGVSLVDRGCDRTGPLDISAPLQENVGELPNLISSAYSEEQTFTPVSSSVHVLEHEDRAAMLSPSAGVTEAASPVACAGQKVPQVWRPGGSPGQPESSDSQQRLVQRPAETNQSGGGGAGTDPSTGLKTDQGEELKVREESFKNPQLSEQHLHLSETHSGMHEHPPPSPQQAPSASKSPNSPSRGGPTSIFNLPQPPPEINNLCFSQRQSSITHNHQTENLLQSNLSKHVKEQLQLTESQKPRQTETKSHQENQHEQKRTLSIQHGNTKGIINFPSCTQHVCHLTESAKGKGTAGWTGNTQMSNNSMNTENTGMSSQAFPYPEPERDTKAWPSADFTAQSSDSGRSDMNSKYQPFFLTGFHPSDCLNGVVRPVPSCLENSEDTSSSDEEGKLIIEL